MVNIIVGSVINVALLVFWFSIFYLFNRKKTIIPIMLLGVAVGISGVFTLAIAIERFGLAAAGIQLAEGQRKALIAPMVEEGSKLLFIFLSLRLLKMSTSGNNALGASVGLGFAFVENSAVLANPLNVFFRGFSSWLMHIGTATLLAYGVWYALQKHRFVRLPVFFIIAMLVHSAFNLAVFLLGYG